MTVIHHAESRRTETPNHVMTTLASPTQGGAERPLWRVDIAPGASGPEHIFDVEQVWTVLSGGATFVLAGESTELKAGDTVVMPAAAIRQVHADPVAGLSAIVTARAGARATRVGESESQVPPWVR
jgi:quercetin dioxygenase-like cupin family protein